MGMKYSAQEVGLFTKELLKVVWFQSIKGGRLGLLVRFANEFFVFLIDYMNLYLFDAMRGNIGMCLPSVNCVRSDLEDNDFICYAL